MYRRNITAKAFLFPVFPLFKQIVQVHGTWEALCKVICPEDYEEIIEIGYPAVGNYKARWAEEISRYMEPELNISPSFINFKMALNFAIRDPKPISGHRIRSF